MKSWESVTELQHTDYIGISIFIALEVIDSWTVL